MNKKTDNDATKDEGPDDNAASDVDAQPTLAPSDEVGRGEDDGDDSDEESDEEVRNDVAFILIAYDDAFALEENRQRSIEFLERATDAFASAQDDGYRLDGPAWDRLNENFPDIADYLMAASQMLREEDSEGLGAGVEEIFSLGFGFQTADEVEDGLHAVGRFYRITVDATEPTTHEGLPLAFWSHLGAEGAAEVTASSIEQRLIEMLEHRQDVIGEALFALVDDGMVWDLLADSADSMIEEAIFDFLEEHWPGAALVPDPTSTVAPEVVAEFTLEREDGFQYFVDADGDVSRSPSPSKEGEAPSSGDVTSDGVKSEKVVRCGIARDDDWLYYIGPTGNIVRVPMYRAGADDDE